MLALQAIHRSLWRQRARVLTWFGVAVLLLLPTAVSLSPGADASFTFSPDPAMTRVVNLARTPPAEGAHWNPNPSPDPSPNPHPHPHPHPHPNPKPKPKPKPKSKPKPYP